MNMREIKRVGTRLVYSGLPKVSSAVKIDVGDDDRISGLFKRGGSEKAVI